MGANMNSNTLNNCLLCGDKSDKKVTEYKASIWAKNKMFSKALIHSCQNCGVGYIKNPPDRTELNTGHDEILEIVKEKGSINDLYYPSRILIKP